ASTCYRITWGVLILSAVYVGAEEWDDYCRYRNGVDSTCAITSDGEMRCTPAGPACGTFESYVVSETATTTVPSSGPDINQIRSDCDRYCQVVNDDENSYCKWWLEYAVCIGGDQPCGTAALCGIPVDDNPPGGPEGDGLYYADCDAMCQSLNNDEGSFCKWWLNVPVCKQGNQPCGDVEACKSQDWAEPQTTLPSVEEFSGHPHHSPACDSYCQSLNDDDSSYCKWWKAEPVCRGGDQPCGPVSCSSEASQTTVLPQDRHSGPDLNCDAYCKDQNPASTDDESYCKWWLHVPVCKSGDQVCSPSICRQYSTSAP
ncbi:hypothetical protein Pmar_PMAR025060, partial [Perkinsus marinus ATCC 50983]